MAGDGGSGEGVVSTGVIDFGGGGGDAGKAVPPLNFPAASGEGGDDNRGGGGGGVGGFPERGAVPDPEGNDVVGAAAAGGEQGDLAVEVEAYEVEAFGAAGIAKGEGGAAGGNNERVGFGKAGGGEVAGLGRGWGGRGDDAIGAGGPGHGFVGIGQRGPGAFDEDTVVDLEAESGAGADAIDL